MNQAIIDEIKFSSFSFQETIKTLNEQQTNRRSEKITKEEKSHGVLDRFLPKAK